MRIAHRDGRDVVLLTDSQEAFEPLAGAAATIPIRQQHEHPAAYGVVSTMRRLPEQALVHDDNYRTPRLPVERSTAIRREVTEGRWVEYGPHAKTPDEAARLSRIRAEELGVRVMRRPRYRLLRRVLRP